MKNDSINFNDRACQENENTEPKTYDYEVTIYLTDERTITVTCYKFPSNKSQFLSVFCSDDFVLLDHSECKIYIHGVPCDNDILVNMKNVIFIKVKELLI